MRSVYLLLRNFFCGSLAVAVIALGRVRRARKKALDSDVVTAIYFHNPTKGLFSRCVQWLSKNGYTFISADELIKILREGAQPPRGAVWLSFDDGFKELLETVLPLVRERKIPITMFIPSGIVQGAGLFPWLQSERCAHAAGIEAPAQNEIRDAMSVADVREIAKFGEITIGSHTVGHRVTTSLSDEEARFEFGESKRVLESWTGKAVACFAYPEGRFDGRESRFLSDYGYQLAATTEATFGTRKGDPYLVPRFHVGDSIPFPEAVCNMVGVWRPAIDPMIDLVTRCFSFIDGLRQPYKNYDSRCGQKPT
jgi:peptidoglycan/xylan/chitin deacetylase (PgdA/CDA1 family)